MVKRYAVPMLLLVSATNLDDTQDPITNLQEIARKHGYSLLQDEALQPHPFDDSVEELHSVLDIASFADKVATAKGSEQATQTSVENQKSALQYAIYSPNESATSDGAGFWSNDFGWTTFGCATKFTEAEKHTLDLPIATGQDAKWVTWSEAESHYAESIKESTDDSAGNAKSVGHINAAQRVGIETYQNGEFSYILECKTQADFNDEVKHCGDSTLKLLLTQLSTFEDCHNTEEAIRRLDKAINDLTAVKNAIAILPFEEFNLPD